MCNIRGFRHRCSHTIYRYVSTCRATFGDPNSPSTPRCLPSASFIIKLADECMNCQYENFCRSWEERIAAAEQRRDVFAAQLNPRLSQRDKWASKIRSVNDWDTWGDLPSGADDATLMDESYWADVEEINDTDDGLNVIERSMLIKERDEADQQATKLQHEFELQKWENWQGYLNSSDVSTLRKRANYWSKRRRTSPKVNCGSPLKRVENVKDLPAPTGSLVDVYLFGTEDLSGDESDGSDCSSTPALSRSSTVSDDLTSSDDEIETMSEEAEIEGLEEFKRILEACEMKRKANKPVESATIIQEEEDNGMLPVWLECH